MPQPAGFHLRTNTEGWTSGGFSALDDLPDITHLVTTRQGPLLGQRAESLQTSRATHAIAAALDLQQIASCHQVHGRDILTVAAGGVAGAADALITDVPGLGLLGRSADCPLILAAAPGRGVGMAHASWRSTVAGITARMIYALGDTFSVHPEEITAVICPSAGPCCYEVGPEVREQALDRIGPAATAFFAVRDRKLMFDLWLANTIQLELGGVSRENIHCAEICTICRNDLFPSYRAEGGTAARFAAVIGMRGPIASRVNNERAEARPWLKDSPGNS